VYSVAACLIDKLILYLEIMTRVRGGGLLKRIRNRVLPTYQTTTFTAVMWNKYILFQK
jgi:hypothetical protein